MNAEKIDVVLSFPLPPKQFYEHLSVEEIKLAQPPSLPENTDTFSPFGLARPLNLSSEDELNFVFDKQVIGKLHAAKSSILAVFSDLFAHIDSVQDAEKTAAILRRLDESMSCVFDLTKRLRLLQTLMSIDLHIQEKIEEMEHVLQETVI